MLPSMPILFPRDSQDAFGNKIEPSTSFFGQKIDPIPIKSTPPVPTPPPTTQKLTPKEVPKKVPCKKKEVVEEQCPKLDGNAQEAALVAAYYSKVQSKFASNTRVPNNKFVQFRDILKSFDPAKETPIELFRKIEQLFADDQRDLAEEFLLFLTPGQAAHVGRFMDQFMLLQLNNFIELLKITFSRKPTMLRKVLRAITNSLKCGTVEEMKAKVLPHLRSNPRLSQMFRSLFPDEKPPESLYETGTDIIHESFLTEDKGRDVWQFDENVEDSRRNLDVKETLDTVYLQGRVFLQHGRNLRPARVSYPYSKEPYRVHARRLAPAHCRLSPPESDDERSPRRKNANKNPPKRPKKAQSKVKNVKDVNDNTKQNNTDSPKMKRANKRQPKKETENAKRKDKLEAGTKAKQAKVEDKKEAEKLKSSSWTRDEDKTMLELLKGQSVSDHVFLRIKELLPHRSVTEIKDRFFHVMTLLQQMAVADVT